MSQQPADGRSGDSRQRSRSAVVGAVGEIARWALFFRLPPSWALFAWLVPHGVLLVVAACAVGALVLVGLLVVFGVMATTVSEDVRYQCDSAIGPDPSASVAATPDPGDEGEPTEVSTPSTTNPYAALEPDDAETPWAAACFRAMKDAPYQLPPVRATNQGAAADCAARLGLSRVGRELDQASLVRLVIYHASTAPSTGRCELPPGTGSSADADSSPVDLPPGTDASADAVAPAVGLPPGIESSAGAAAPTVDLLPGADSPDDAGAPTGDLPTASTCPDSTTAMLMPDTITAQGVCGQRVDLTAVSAGDLVFWDHRDNAPQRVGIAVGPTELVSIDGTTGLVARQAIPVDNDVRVKRVLPLG